jgi:hypothetical protein
LRRNTISRSSPAIRRAPAPLEHIGGFRVLPALDSQHGRGDMNGIIYIIGLIVVIMAILSFLGLH